MHVETDDGVLRIAFDRPEARNAITAETAATLAETIADASPDEHDAIVLTGEGDAFCAGGDLESLSERPGDGREAYAEIEEFGRIVEAMLESPVPIVAKVDGDAVGAGLSIVALADIAYAATDATFSCAFVRIGLIPDTGGTFMLPRIVGLRTAKELAFTGKFFDAERAADLDLINEAVAPDALDDRVAETLEALRGRPTETIGMMKRAIHENMARHWSEALDHENLVQAQARTTDAHAEGVAAFLEDREPEFDT